MIIVKALAVYAIIYLLGFIRYTTIRFLFGSWAEPTEDENKHFKLILGILFAAIIIREGLW